MNWYISSVLAFIFFSLQYYVYKIATEKKANTELVTLFLMATTAVIGFSVLAIKAIHVGDYKSLLLLTAGSSTTFILATNFRLQSLKYIPSSVAFFIFDFKILTIALISILYFKDKVTPLQLLGILIAMLSVLTVIKKQHGEQAKYGKYNWGVLFALGVVLALTLNSLAIKQGAIMHDQWAFIAFAGLIGSLFALGSYLVRIKRQRHDQSKLFSIGIGSIVGVLNVVAFYFEFTALKTGPLAVVTAIVSFSTIGAIVLSSITFKEKVGLKRGVAILLGFLSLLLLR